MTHTHGLFVGQTLVTINTICSSLDIDSLPREIDPLQHHGRLVKIHFFDWCYWGVVAVLLLLLLLELLFCHWFLFR